MKWVILFHLTDDESKTLRNHTTRKHQARHWTPAVGTQTLALTIVRHCRDHCQTPPCPQRSAGQWNTFRNCLSPPSAKYSGTNRSNLVYTWWKWSTCLLMILRCAHSIFWKANKSFESVRSTSAGGWVGARERERMKKVQTGRSCLNIKPFLARLWSSMRGLQTYTFWCWPLKWRASFHRQDLSSCSTEREACVL